MPQKGVRSNIIWFITILAAGMYGALCLYLFFMQARLLYYPDTPSRKLTASPGDIGLAYESLAITTGDGITIHGWFVPAQPERGTLLFFHGNAGNISTVLIRLKSFTIWAFQP